MNCLHLNLEHKSKRVEIILWGRGNCIQSRLFTSIEQVNTCFLLCSNEGRRCMDFLLKTKSKIKCLTDNEVIYYDNGLEAYEHIHQQFILSSIEVKDNILVLELKPIVNGTEWEEDFKKQFGSDPSFF